MIITRPPLRISHGDGSSSYGVERLAYYRMRPQMGPPETTIWEYPGGDDSWRLETEEFITDTRQSREPSPSLRDGIRTMKVVEEIYRRSGYPRP